jgi:hypothetical protein
LSTGLVLAGLGMIVFRRSAVLLRLAVMVLIGLFLYGLLDYSVYFMAPALAPEFVRTMSPQAQLRHYNARKETEAWIYEEHFRYGRPFAELDGATADEFGYRNPPGYMDGVDKVDVLLIGDSFLWGTAELTIADYMRAQRPEQTVYTTGIFGNSIVQWRYHFEDYVGRIGQAPAVVVFNFYPGNDLSDTAFYHRVQGFVEEDTAVSYFVYYNSPYLVPNRPGAPALPKLPESAFILMGSLTAREFSGAAPTRLNTVYSIDESWPIANEPRGEEFADSIMAEIEAAVVLVHSLAPETRVVISYIPTIAAVYGDLLADCPWCAADIGQQRENSAVVAGLAGRLGIDFVDVTPRLQEAALERPLWAPDGHFSAYGYEVYAAALGEAVGEG